MGEPSIQALVTCLWSHSVWKVHIVELLTTLASVVLLWYWGVCARQADTETMPPMRQPILWSCLLGLAIKDGLEILEWVFQYHHRHNRAASESLSCKEIASHMWGFHTFCRLTPIFTDMLGLVVRLALLIFAVLFPNPKLWSTSGDFAFILLSLNIAEAFVRLMRLVQMIGTVGLNFVAVLSSLLSGRMPQMLMIFWLVLLMFVAIFNVLIRNQTTYYMTLYLYRGLIFGDGDGLDFMGMKTDYTDDSMPEPQEQPFHAATKGTFMFFATIIFNIVILNLVIAVYGNEYDQMVEKSEGVFTRMRARYCAKQLILETAVEGRKTNAMLFFEKTRLVALGYTFSLATIIISIAWLTAANEGSCIAGCLIAFGLQLLRARIMSVHSEWFDDCHSMETQTPFYLWWCRPEEYKPERFKTKDAQKDEEQVMLEKIADQVHPLVKNAGVGSDFEKLHREVKHLDKQTEKVRKAVERLRR